MLYILPPVGFVAHLEGQKKRGGVEVRNSSLFGVS